MPDLELENDLRSRGQRVIAGVDEAGRGPLAGPVVAGAAVLPDDFSHHLVNDSKKISEKKRELLFDELSQRDDIHWAVSVVGAEEVDAVNILRATHLGMARAVDALAMTVDFCLIDGLPVPDFPLAHRGVVKGDAKSLSIAAASIFAKVTRDRLMREFAREFPDYGFEKHKGYGTKAHLAALKTHGPCRLHRRSFQPVAQLALPFGEQGAEVEAAGNR